MKRLAIAIIALTLLLPTPVLADQADTLAGEIRALDQRAVVKDAQLQKLSRKAAKARRELTASGRDLAQMQQRRREAARTLGRLVRASYTNAPANEYAIIAGRETVTQSIASQFYLSGLERYADRMVDRLDHVAKQIRDRRAKLRKTNAKLEKMEQRALAEADQLGTLREQKARLLAETGGSEEVFQNQYQSARQQLAATGRFARAARQRISSRVWPDDGFYFNQLDSRWVDNKLGFSETSTFGDYGCGLTAAAMVFESHGITTAPPELNEGLKRAGAFVGDLLDWRKVPAAAGGRLKLANEPYPVSRSRIDWGLIDKELAVGNPVIVYVERPGQQSHYVVLTRKRAGDYIMDDPIEGPGLRFSRYYQTEAVSQFIVFEPAT